MDRKKKKILGSFLAIIMISLVIPLCISWENNETFRWGLFLTLLIGLSIDLTIAIRFGMIAEEKGYNCTEYADLCFIFTIIGYLMVIALPDRGSKAEVATDELPDL